MKLREVVVSHDGWVSRNDKVFNYIQVSLHLSLNCLARIQTKSYVQQELIIKDRVKGRNNGRNDLVSVQYFNFLSSSNHRIVSQDCFVDRNRQAATNHGKKDLKRDVYISQKKQRGTMLIQANKMSTKAVLNQVKRVGILTLIL